MQSQNFWRNKHSRSHQVLCSDPELFVRGSEMTFELFGLKHGIILAPIHQRDCSSDPFRVTSIDRDVDC